LKEIFHWGPHFIGGVFMLVGICDILSRVILLPQMLKKWSEQTIGKIGLLGLSIGLGLLFFSSFQQSIYYIAIAVAFIVLGEGLFDPSYNARLSVSVDESKQGVLQGTNHSLQALYRIIVPLGAAFIYTFHPGAVFALASILMICGLILFSKLK
jgi:DHA1 family tetracycline resistance protein-like MFS transporter